VSLGEEQEVTLLYGILNLWGEAHWRGRGGGGQGFARVSNVKPTPLEDRNQIDWREVGETSTREKEPGPGDGLLVGEGLEEKGRNQKNPEVIRDRTGPAMRSRVCEENRGSGCEK